VSTVENGQKIVCFFTNRSEALRFFANARGNGLPCCYGELIDEIPTFPDS
jgi:hypothetical protein